MTSVHVVIPVLNGWEKTEKCLTALEPLKRRGHEVHVVDHGSTDETKVELPRSFPEVTHLIASPSLWWAGATNVGVRHALATGADFIVPLNNDCVYSPADLERVVALASDNDAIVSPVQRSIEDRRILAVSATTSLGLGFPTFHVVTTLEPGGNDLIATEVIMGGRGAVIPRRVFSEVGLFAEDDLPHYLADHDFYLRCRRAGVSMFIARDAEVLVDETRTSTANELETMSWTEFRQSLAIDRSHRNIRAVSAFFRRNYPIRGLWRVGVFLNTARYFTVWVVARIRNALRV